MTQTVLITGTSSGFGEATTKLFSERGWNVVATMRNPEANGTLQSGDKLLVARLDVEDPGSIETAITAGIERFGRIDTVVNNAGYGLFAIFEGASPEAVKQQFDVNLFGVMDVTRAILPHFRANRQGTIINVTSGAGVIGFPMASLYSASKFAIEGFTEALGYELYGLGIKVKLVEPGGAPGTGFMKRSGMEGAELSVPTDYFPFLNHISKLYDGMTQGADPDAVEKVASTIFEAATDGSDRLRYLPTNDIMPLVDARRGATEAQYQALVRRIFLSKVEDTSPWN